MQRASLAYLALTLCGSLAACTDPPSSATIRRRLSEDLGRVLKETTAASQTPIPGATSLSWLGSVLPAIPLSGSGTAVTARFGDLLSGVGVGGRAPRAAAVGLGLDADATVAYLNERIFIDANHVGDGIYRVPAALACARTTIDASGATTQTLDADCATRFDEVQLRIRVEQDGARLRFAIQIDAQHDEPISLLLGHDGLGVSFNLDDAGKALAALARLTGVAAPNVRLAGQITAQLDVLGTAHARAALTVDRDVVIAVADAGKPLDGNDAFRFASAKARVLTVELDGGAKTAEFELGLASTTVAIPGTHPVAIDLAGATAKAVLADGQPLQVTHVGLGDRTFTVSRNGRRAIAINLNPDHGRALDATITAVAAGETLTVSPELDLRIAVDHAALGDAPGVYDVTQVRLDGSIRSAPTSGFAVETGSFGLVTDPASYGVSAVAGQCVSSTIAIDASSGKSYERWSAATCP
jgi:hypothetical protein